MEKKEIYYDQNKALVQMSIGVGIFLLVFFLLGLSALGIFAMLLACSYLYIASKSLSSKPQLVFSEEGLYVGFKMEKTLPWKTIESIVVRKVKVDFRKIDHIEITSRIKSNGPSNKLVRRFPVQNLKISVEDLNLVIKEFRADRSKGEEEVIR